MSSSLGSALLGLAVLAGPAEEPLRAERDVPRPERLHHVPARYPETLRGVLPAVMGLVFMDVALDEEGRPVDIKLLSGKPLLDQAAVDAVKQWRYRQTIVEGRPRRVTLVEVVDLFPGEDDRVRFFTKMLNDPKSSKTYRLLALEFLRDIGAGNKDVRKALEKSASDPDPEVRSRAAELLRSGPAPAR
jgi:TonB-like protein